MRCYNLVNHFIFWNQKNLVGTLNSNKPLTILTCLKTYPTVCFVPCVAVWRNVLYKTLAAPRSVVRFGILTTKCHSTDIPSSPMGPERVFLESRPTKYPKISLLVPSVLKLFPITLLFYHFGVSIGLFFPGFRRECPAFVDRQTLTIPLWYFWMFGSLFLFSPMNFKPFKKSVKY